MSSAESRSSVARADSWMLVTLRAPTTGATCVPWEATPARATRWTDTPRRSATDRSAGTRSASPPAEPTPPSGPHAKSSARRGPGICTGSRRTTEQGRRVRLLVPAQVEVREVGAHDQATASNAPARPRLCLRTRSGTRRAMPTMRAGRAAASRTKDAALLDMSGTASLAVPLREA